MPTETQALLRPLANVSVRFSNHESKGGVAHIVRGIHAAMVWFPPRMQMVGDRLTVNKKRRTEARHGEKFSNMVFENPKFLRGECQCFGPPLLSGVSGDRPPSLMGHPRSLSPEPKLRFNRPRCRTLTTGGSNGKKWK